MKLTWKDSEDIDLAPQERFVGDPKKSRESILAALQMAWHEEHRDQ